MLRTSTETRPCAHTLMVQTLITTFIVIVHCLFCQFIDTYSHSGHTSQSVLLCIILSLVALCSSVHATSQTKQCN